MIFHGYSGNQKLLLGLGDSSKDSLGKVQQRGRRIKIESQSTSSKHLESDSLVVDNHIRFRGVNSNRKAVTGINTVVVGGRQSMEDGHFVVVTCKKIFWKICSMARGSSWQKSDQRKSIEVWCCAIVCVIGLEIFTLSRRWRHTI